MARTYGQLAQEARDTGFQDRVQTAIIATAISIAQNGSSSAPRKALAQSVLNSPESYAKQWSLGVRVAGINIILDILTDAQISTGGEVIFAALAGV